MYVSRYGFQRRPFPTTPDGSFYYPASGHETVLHSLMQAVEDMEGFALATGEIGAGKTLLGHCLLERIDEKCDIALMTLGRFADRAALLQAVLFELGLACEDTHEQSLRLRLVDHLFKTAADGKCSVLVFDEAHHLTADQLEDLRLLGNLEGGSAKAVQIILLGQPKLQEMLRNPMLRSLSQRITVRNDLALLDVEEAVDYLRHHIRIAGVRPDEVIDDTALEIIARSSRGVPRLLNQAAHCAFRLADLAEMDAVDAEAALEAQSQLGLEMQQTEEPVVRRDEPHETVVARPHFGVVHADDSDREVRLFDSKRESA